MVNYRALVLLTGLLAVGAEATTIDFEEFEPGTNGLGSIESKGFTLTATGTGAFPPDYA